MPIICPRCTGATVAVTLSLEFPPDGSSDEVTLQLLECSACDFRGVGLYEESRRGSLERESFRHGGWHVASADFEQIKALIASCSQPREAYCDCHAHVTLGKTDDMNNWDGLRQNGYVLGEWFRVDLADVD